MQTTYTLIGKIYARQPLATCSKDLKDREQTKNGPIPVPKAQLDDGEHLMYPGTGLRGKIRRACRDVVRASVIEKTGDEKPFSLPQHYLLTLGGIKGEGEQDRISVSLESDWRAKNPLLSLFGAGDAGVLGFVQGHASVGNAICTQTVSALPPMIFSGARTDDLYRDKSQVAFLSDDDINQLVAQARGGKDRSGLQADMKKLEIELKTARVAARKSGVNDDVVAIEAKLEALKEKVKAVKDDTGTSDVSIGMPLAGWQAIPQGAVLEQKITLSRSNPIELGLILKGLNVVALDPFVGAHYANGCGEIAGSWEVFEVTLKGKQSIGTVSFEPHDCLKIEGTALDAAVKSFDDLMMGDSWNYNIPTV